MLFTRTATTDLISATRMKPLKSAIVRLGSVLASLRTTRQRYIRHEFWYRHYELVWLVEHFKKKDAMIFPPCMNEKRCERALAAPHDLLSNRSK
jgi:hypothetical protein